MNTISPLDDFLAYLKTDEFCINFLDAAQKGTGTDADRFFQPLFSRLLPSLSLVVRGGIPLLYKCREINVAAYESIPKGTPFYWLGVATYSLNDYERSFFFLDAAVKEDSECGIDPNFFLTPVFLFVLLNSTPREQAARALVTDAQNRIRRSITDYNVLVESDRLSLELLREHFLMKALQINGENWRSLATALITFGLEWDDRNILFDIRPSNGTLEPFFLHLFKGCVLFESILKQNPKFPEAKNKTNLDQLLKLLFSHLELEESPDIHGKKLPTILTRLSNLPNQDETIDIAIQYTG
jgi:hypothetical protein